MIFGKRRREPTPDPYAVRTHFNPGPTPVEWEELERELLAHAGRLAQDASAAVVFDVGDTGHFTQWGGGEGTLLSEASATVDAAGEEKLAEIGWIPPITKGLFPTDNWSLGWNAPLDAFYATRIMLYTLREVYGAHPSQIRVNPVG